MTIKMTPFKTISLTKTSQIDQLTAWLQLPVKQRGVTINDMAQRIKSHDVKISNNLLMDIINDKRTIDDMTLAQIRELHAIYLENYEESTAKSKEEIAREQLKKTTDTAVKELM